MSSKGKINNVHQIVDRIIKNFIKPGFLCVDGTLGNGYDSEKILNLLNGNGFLYSFDIQKEAIKNSKNLLNKTDYKNYHLILDSHENVDKYIKNEIDFFIMNLGYLPKGDKSITTTAETTIKFLSKINYMLRPNGLGLIVFYLGHDEGAREGREVYKYLEGYNQKEFNILKVNFLNQKNIPPELVIIERI